MSDKLRAAAQFALETLENVFGKDKIDVGAINMLRAALAEPEQEPVAWYHNGFGTLELSRVQRLGWSPLYTAPPRREWVPLTKDEIAEIENEYIVDYRIPAGCSLNFAKDIEAKLKEKNK